MIASQVGKDEVAVQYIGRAIRLQGNAAFFHNNLGETPIVPCIGFPEAIACFRRALELNPDFAKAHNNLGIALNDQGKRTKRSPATAGHWNSSRTMPRRTTTWAMR